MHVLVHVDQGLGPIGAWGYNGKLRHFYPESLDTAISARARELMASRATNISVTDWMDLMADADPTLIDEYHAFETSDDAALPGVLAEFRRSWVSSRSGSPRSP